MHFENLDLAMIFTPIRVHQLASLLEETNFDVEDTQFLIEGFSKGFNLGYQGKNDVRMTSPNLKLTVGSTTELWNKVMSEVGELRFAGPYKNIPFNHYIQSPIGLVPKDVNKTRLIFHLSYPRGTDLSVNINTPKEECSVNYPQFDKAIKLCIEQIKIWGRCVLGKSDLKSAF